MREINLVSGDLEGVVLPDYGGMLAKLFYKGRPVFFLDEEMLLNSNVLAGGNPVLFPFPSKTKDDCYRIDQKTYSMPFHGLVKYSQFGVMEVKSDMATLYMESTDIGIRQNFPFRYRLELTYSLNKDTAGLDVRIYNFEDRAMPHYFGWHPYFTASDKGAFTIDAPMKRYVNYADGSMYDIKTRPDFKERTDYIYDERTEDVLVINNPADGYRVDMTLDKAFDVLVVCTKFDKAICVEPWMGMPDSINTGKYLKWVAPQSDEKYSIKMHMTNA